MLHLTGRWGTCGSALIFLASPMKGIQGTRAKNGRFERSRVTIAGRFTFGATILTGHSATRACARVWATVTRRIKPFEAQVAFEGIACACIVAAIAVRIGGDETFLTGECAAHACIVAAVVVYIDRSLSIQTG